jgi:hypothetical protein
MVSSDRFGGGVTGARSRVQVGPALGAESGTILTAEQEVRRTGEGQLLSDYGSDIHRVGPLGKWIEIRIVGRLGIGAEHGGVHVHIHIVEHLREAPPALAVDDGVNVPTPEVLAVTSGLQLAIHLHRPCQVEVQPLERRIAGRELADGPHGTSVEVPDVDSQHSRLT